MPYKTFTIEEATSSDVNTYLMQQAVITCTAGTRPGSPVSGMRIWQTDTLTGYIYVGGSWVLHERVAPLTRKTASESVFNSTTLQNDDHLVVAVQPNASYIMELFLIYDTLNTAGLKIGWTFPTGATMTWSTHGYEDPNHNTAVVPISVATHVITDVVTLNAENTSPHPPVAIHVRGILLTSSTAGTLQLQWAQNSAQADFANVNINSFLRLIRLD